jgi:glutathione S-transferase
MTEFKLTLYELAAADPAVRFSPHCWKTRMALAHKGLIAERVPWRFTEKEMIARSGQPLVPVLLDGGHVISDSWAIALHLDERFADRPALFGGPRDQALARFVNSWADTILLPAAIARLILTDIHDALAERDKAYFRSSREARFGMPLEMVVADRDTNLAAFQQLLASLRSTLKAQPFLSGQTPAYADYCVFGMFMWVHCISSIAILESQDPVYAWRERLMDAFGGLARSAPVQSPQSA